MPEHLPPVEKGGGSAPIYSPGFQKASILVYLTVSTAIFLWMIRDFLMPFFVAGIFTGLTYPAYRRVLEYCRGRAVVAALATLFGITLIVILPLGVLGTIAYQEALRTLAKLDFSAIRVDVEEFLDGLKAHFPMLLQGVHPHDISRQTFGMLRRLMDYLVSNGATLSFSIIHRVFRFAVMLLAMFFFYIDGPRIIRKLIRWSPLKDEYDEQLLRRFVAVSKGTLKGLLVIGLIQGTVGSILFSILGLHSAIFLGSLMILGSAIPIVGGGLVWFPVALTLVFTGRPMAGVIVLVVCGLILHSVDSILRARIVGQDIKMHDLLVLASTLGGIAMFGPVGFIVGPIIASVFLSVWALFEEVFRDELKGNRKGAAPPGGAV